MLGRVDAIVDGRPLPLRRRKQRAVLAMLALRANRTVATDELIDGLWGDRPPASAAKNVQSYVSQLRKALASDDSGARIVTRGRGYELQAPGRRGGRGALRAPRRASPERGRAGDRRRRRTGRARAVASAPRSPTSPQEPFAGAEIRRLEELHLRAIELAIDAELAAGRHADAIGSLEALIAEHPRPRALPRPAHARALPRRAPVRGRGGLPRRPPHAEPSRSGSSPGPSCAASRSRSSPTTPPSTPARRRGAAAPARGRLAASRRSRPRAAVAAQALGRGRGGSDPGGARLRPRGDRQDPARRRARRRGPTARRRSSTPRARAPPTPRSRRSAAPRTSELPDPARARRRRRRLARRARGRGRARGASPRESPASPARAAPRRAGPAGVRRRGAEACSSARCGSRPPPRSPSSTRRPTAWRCRSRR